jgi:DNA-directed RNA polymerase subunit K/omega
LGVAAAAYAKQIFQPEAVFVESENQKTNPLVAFTPSGLSDPQ